MGQSKGDNPFFRIISYGARSRRSTNKGDVFSAVGCLNDNIFDLFGHAQVIERELVDTDVAKHYPSVPVSEAKYEQFNLAEDNKVMFNSGKEATMIVEEARVRST